MKKIELTKGQVAFVDDEDFEWLNQWKWAAAWKPHINNYYAMRSSHMGMINGKQKTKSIYMHRIIVKAPKGMFVDHINHNPLDNRKENLRLVTRRQNQQNRKDKSKFPGVRKHGHKWLARIRINGKNKYLGLFSTEIAAAKAYEKECRKTGQELVCKTGRRVKDVYLE